MGNHKPITDEELNTIKEWLSHESGTLFGMPATVSTHDNWLAQCVEEIDWLKRELAEYKRVMGPLPTP